MSYSADAVRRARVRLAQAKAAREAENREKLEQAYARVPRIRQIDQELRHTMAVALQTIFSMDTNSEAIVDQAKQANLALQRERQSLIDRYFPEGFPDDSPICPHCGGNGYVGSRMCRCLTELCRQEQRKELNFLSDGKEHFDQFRLDYYPDRVDGESGVNIRALMGRTLKTCRRYAETFSEASGNLLFSGGTGLGKTFLSACVAYAVADKGYSVVYESAGNLFGKLEKARFGGSEDARAEAERFTNCDLLLIDDLGTELQGQFVNAALYALLNDRLLAQKPMIISTNLTADALARRYTPQIASRLRGNFQRVPFLGEDIRLRKDTGETL